MKSGLVSLCAAALLVGSTHLVPGAVIFYDGDPNGGFSYDMHVYTGNGLGESFRNWVYSDFTVPANQTWTVTGMYGNFTNPDPNAAGNIPNFQYEIRTGMSGANPGTLLDSDSGIPAATSTDEGFQVEGWEAYAYSINLPSSITLTGGTTYWLAMIPISLNGYNVGIQSTGNANSVSSLKNQTSEYVSWSYLDPTDVYSQISGDYSVGMTGSIAIVPEPATMAMLLLPASALFLRRRRACAK